MIEDNEHFIEYVAWTVLFVSLSIAGAVLIHFIVEELF